MVYSEYTRNVKGAWHVPALDQIQTQDVAFTKYVQSKIVYDI